MLDVRKLRDQHQHDIAGRRLALGSRAFADMVLENSSVTGRRHVEWKALQAAIEGLLGSCDPSTDLAIKTASAYDPSLPVGAPLRERVVCKNTVEWDRA